MWKVFDISYQYMVACSLTLYQPLPCIIVWHLLVLYWTITRTKCQETWPYHCFAACILRWSNTVSKLLWMALSILLAVHNDPSPLLSGSILLAVHNDPSPLLSDSILLAVHNDPSPLLSGSILLAVHNDPSLLLSDSILLAVHNDLLPLLSDNPLLISWGEVFKVSVFKVSPCMYQLL